MLWQGGQAQLYETYCKHRPTQPERKRPSLPSVCRKSCAAPLEKGL